MLLALLLSFVSGGHAQSRSGLSGFVTDSFGALIPEAVITLYSADRVIRTTADQEGHFAFPNAPSGKYQLEASRTGFKTETVAVVSADSTGPNPINITLAVASGGDCSRQDSIYYDKKRDAGSWTLRVQVLDSEHPLAKASLHLTQPAASRTQVSQLTNEAGELRLGNLKVGQYVLRVSYPGYWEAQTGSFWITRENQTTVVVQMLKHGLIKICE